MVASLIEFVVERSIDPHIKEHKVVAALGCVLVVLGEAIRKAAVVTAGKSFSHTLSPVKRNSQKLVTHGIYRYIRHPAYLGWSIWVLGTQMVLQNPICIVGFAALTCTFFRRRIAIEEAQLRIFFGSAYIQYQQHTPTWMPFVP